MLEGEGGDIKTDGVVKVVERLGGDTYLYIDLDTKQQITVLVDGDVPTKIGDSITIGIRSEACHLFDARGNSLTRLERHPLTDAPIQH
jgi:multiple sugar transport system ATP-binding protein